MLEENIYVYNNNISIELSVNVLRHPGRKQSWLKRIQLGLVLKSYLSIKHTALFASTTVILYNPQALVWAGY